MALDPTLNEQEIAAVNRATGQGRTLAAAMPRLILEARRIAATVIHGLHGRRRAGSGENFWQYRRFVSGEPAQRLVRRLPVGESVVDAILQLVRSARPGPEGGEVAKAIAWGPGPRASQALMLAVRARALLDGRYAPSVDDVVELAEPILKHRMALTFAARADGETITAVIAKLKARIG